MKKSVFLSLVLVASLAFYAQVSGFSISSLGAVFAWEKTTHDFGKIEQGTPVTAIFTFTNEGDAPIVITQAKGSCGCTVPSYPQEPIAPGASAEVKAVFNAATLGVFNKTVTITANTDKPQILRVKGEVVAKQQ